MRALGGMFAGAIDFDDVLIDVVGYRRLLFHGGGDLLVLINDHADGAENILQGLLDLLRLAHRAVSHFMAGAHGPHRRVYSAE